MWAVARYDLSLSWEEFEELTPVLFNALCARRNIHFKYDRFAAGMVCSAVYNVNRTSKDAPMLTAFDFVREPDSKREQTDKILGTIKQVVGAMPSDTPRAKLLEVRECVVNSLTAQGRTDAAELWAECWPKLVP